MMLRNILPLFLHLLRKIRVADSYRRPFFFSLAVYGRARGRDENDGINRSEEHTSELQSLMRISYAVLCLKKKKKNSEQKAEKECEKQKTNNTKTLKYRH